MDSKSNSNSSLALPCILFLVFCSCVRSDLNQDRAKCANELVGLATCLPYVSGESKASSPTLDCCDGLKQVLKNSKVCLCILVKDRNDPNLGLKIDANLALSLPDKCHAPGNISECPALLHLAANSPDAKVFQDFAHNANGTKSSTSTTPTVAANSTAKGSSDKSDGGERRLMEIEMFVGIFIALLVNV